MDSLIERKITPPPIKDGSSVPAQLFFLSQQVSQLVEQNKIREKNELLFKAALETGLQQIAKEMRDRDAVYQEEFKKSRATTRLWGSFGAGIAAFFIKHIWDKLGKYF